MKTVYSADNSKQVAIFFFIKFNINAFIQKEKITFFLKAPIHIC